MAVTRQSIFDLGMDGSTTYHPKLSKPIYSASINDLRHKLLHLGYPSKGKNSWAVWEKSGGLGGREVLGLPDVPDVPDVADVGNVGIPTLPRPALPSCQTDHH